MIFLGDIAAPTEDFVRLIDQTFKSNSSIFSNKYLVCNLEGPLTEYQQTSNEPILFNHPTILDILENNGNALLCLANNHIFDIPEQIEKSLELIKNKNINFVGIAESEPETFLSINISSKNTDFIFFNACWEFLIYNQKNPSSGQYLNLINEKKLIDQVKKERSLNKIAKIVLYFHWNFDLEILPFPMHRQFAKDLIDAGANVVIGTHSHCVQGGEKYKDGYIFYGIGNFLIPHHIFANGKLVYPDFAALQLVPEWDITQNEFICHWFKYSNIKNEHKLEHLVSEKMSGPMMVKYSPYAGMTEKEYIKYFTLNRRKRYGIPIFKNYKSTSLNSILLKILVFRARIARLLAKNNLIKWTN